VAAWVMASKMKRNSFSFPFKRTWTSSTKGGGGTGGPSARDAATGKMDQDLSIFPRDQLAHNYEVAFTPNPNLLDLLGEEVRQGKVLRLLPSGGYPQANFQRARNMHGLADHLAIFQANFDHGLLLSLFSLDYRPSRAGQSRYGRSPSMPRRALGKAG
jgi:hypothetical protein